MNGTAQRAAHFQPYRTGIREPGGVEIVGERWKLTREEADTALSALGIAAEMGKGKAGELYRLLTRADLNEETREDANAAAAEFHRRREREGEGSMSIVSPDDLPPLEQGDIPPYDDDRYWREIRMSTFPKDADTQEPPEGTKYLHELGDDTAFEDRRGDRYRKVCDGPTQGACVITDGKVFAIFDIGFIVRPV